MAFGNQGGYAGDGKSVTEIRDGEGRRFILVFNDSSSTALNNGDVVIVSYVKGASTADLPNAKTPATTAVAVVVGVVNNGALGLTSIAAKSYGYVQVAGYCSKVAVPASTATERYLSATNATLVATDVAAANTDGVTGITAKTFAISKTADTGATGFQEAFLLNREVTI